MSQVGRRIGLIDWFRAHPQFIAVARDFYGRPVALRPYRGEPRPQFRCCGDPAWDWVNVSEIVYLDPEMLPSGFPDEHEDPLLSLTKRPYL